MRQLKELAQLEFMLHNLLKDASNRQLLRIGVLIRKENPHLGRQLSRAWKEFTNGRRRTHTTSNQTNLQGSTSSQPASNEDNLQHLAFE